MEDSLIIILFLVLFIAVFVQIAFWIWGITSIENAIRDDLKRYHDELTLKQIEKALQFARELKKK